MFPWDRKSQTNFRAKKNFHRASSNENHQYVNRSEADPKNNTIEHLPRLRQAYRPNPERDSSFQNQSLNGNQNFYNYQRLEQSQALERSKQPRSHSYTPIEEKIFQANEEQKRSYAKILEDQIKARKVQKAHDKLQSLEHERKVVYGNDFYKHFDSKLEDKFFERTSVIISEHSPNKYVKNLKRGQTEGVTHGSPYGSKGSPPKPRTELDLSNISIIKGETEEENRLIAERTMAYIKKLEYKKELEQQIIEQNLKKKHEKEMRALEERLEEMKYSYTRLKTKAAHEGPNQRMETSFEKSPPRIKGSTTFEVLVKPTEEPKLEKSPPRPNVSNTFEVLVKPPEPLRSDIDPTARKPSFVRKVPQEGRPLNDTKSEFQPVIAPIEKAMTDFASGSPSFEKSPTYPNDNLGGGLWNYMQIQTELGRMRSEFKDYMRGINDKISNLKHEFSESYRVPNDESYRNKDYLHFQVIKEYPRLVATPFNINTSGAVTLQVPPSLGLSTNESKQSLVHDTQFVPLNETLSRPNSKYVPVPPIIPSTRVNTVSSSTTKVQNDIKIQNDTKTQNKGVEYGLLIDDMVNLTKKLEESVNIQQIKINKEMESVRGELNSLKRTEDRELKSVNRSQAIDPQSFDRELKSVNRSQAIDDRELKSVNRSQAIDPQPFDRELKSVNRSQAIDDRELKSVNRGQAIDPQPFDRELKSVNRSQVIDPQPSKKERTEPQLPKREVDPKPLKKEVEPPLSLRRESESPPPIIKKEAEPPMSFRREIGSPRIKTESQLPPHSKREIGSPRIRKEPEPPQPFSRQIGSPRIKNEPEPPISFRKAESLQVGKKEAEPIIVKKFEGGPKILVHEPLESTPDLDQNPSISPSQMTSHESSIIIDGQKQKVRRKSLNITNLTKGVKRNREEMLADSKKKS